MVKETQSGETRVALVPEAVEKFVDLGYAVSVEPGAGEAADVSDQAYVDAGADVDGDRLEDADVVVSVQPLRIEQIRRLRKQAATFSFLPVAEHEQFFEPYFGTPQHVIFEPAARMFGLGYENPRTVVEFVEAYRSASVGGRSTIIEVRTNREENVSLHRDLLAEITRESAP